MQIYFDSVPMAIAPDSLNWTPPAEVAKDGNYAPIRGAFWSCTLSLPKTTVALIGDWYDLFDFDQHTATLPHPRTMVMTDFDCYVTITGIRVNTEGDCPFVAGLDIELSGIEIP